MTGIPAWQAALDRLVNSDPDLDAGAELVVADPDGTEVFRAPLARMWRLDTEDPQTVWIRPVFGGYQDYPTGPWRFALAGVRRRSLAFHTVTVDGDDVTFELVNDQWARIRPVRPDLRAQLERWDTFVLAQLPAEIEADLEALAEDSWHGEWA
jgi:hypothetical protein